MAANAAPDEGGGSGALGGGWLLLLGLLELRRGTNPILRLLALNRAIR